jgi:hypothetical protein
MTATNINFGSQVTMTPEQQQAQARAHQAMIEQARRLKADSNVIDVECAPDLNPLLYPA